MSDKVYVGSRATRFKDKGAFGAVSRVTYFWGDGDDEHFTAGDDTGRELTLFCPSATQAMADSLLETVRGKVYRPFEAQGAVLDPAAEPGDGVTVAGLYSVLAYVRAGSYGRCEVGAPGEKEVDHESPYLTPDQLAMKRKVSLGTSYYGTRITRREGLTVERIVEDAVVAKAVLNADELSFYAGSKRVLFFDPTTNTYRFEGTLNVADNFVVDVDGNVTMKGSINLGSGTISWGDNTPYQSQFAVSADGPWHYPMQDGDRFRRDKYAGESDFGTPYQFVGRDGSDASVPGYIHWTYIGDTQILSPDIYGGHIYATGKGADSGAAYYIYDGATISGGNVELGSEIGYISYDTGGAGTTDEAKNRVIFKTLNVPLKLESAGNMSLDASGYIHVGSPLHARNGLVLGSASYGSSLPATGTVGQVFFLLGG